MSEDELSELALNKNPLVKKLLETYLTFLRDPSKKLHLQILRVTELIAEDLGKLENYRKISLSDLGGDPTEAELDKITLKILNPSSDDKTFAQVMQVIKEAPLMYQAIERGMVACQIKEPEIKAEKRTGRKVMDEGVAL